jgi:putative ABC transport system ATP-binding protein
MISVILELNNVSFHYAGSRTVLHDVNLSVRRNELIIITGESGAGKSTVLKLLNRFCDYRSGNILLDGIELKKYGIAELRRSIIYLPQLPVMIDGSVEQNLSFPFTFKIHRGKTFDTVEVRKWLDHFQLNLPLHTDALTLSIGQRQRIALIRAIILRPQVLLLDEPGASLDRKNRELIDEMIASLIRNTGVTVIMATHTSEGSSYSSYRGFRVSEGRLNALPEGDA